MHLKIYPLFTLLFLDVLMVNHLRLPSNINLKIAQYFAVKSQAEFKDVLYDDKP